MPCARNSLPCSFHPFGGNVFISNWRQGNHTEPRSRSGDDLATSTLCVPLNWHIMAMTHQAATSLCGLSLLLYCCLRGQLISRPGEWVLGFMLSTHLVSEEIAQVFPRVTSVYFPPTMCEAFRSSGSCQYLSPASLMRSVQGSGVSSWLRLAFPWWRRCSVACTCLPLISPAKVSLLVCFPFSIGLFPPFYCCVLIMPYNVLVRRLLSDMHSANIFCL